MQSTPFIADTVGTSRVYFSQMSVIYFCRDLAAVCIIGASSTARCPQGKSWLYMYETPSLLDKITKRITFKV